VVPIKGLFPVRPGSGDTRAPRHGWWAYVRGAVDHSRQFRTVTIVANVVRPPTNEQRVPAYRFGAVLALLLVTFVDMSLARSNRWSDAITVALQGGTLLAALWAAGARRRAFRFVTVITILAVVSALATTPSDTSLARGLPFLLSALLVAVAPVVIVVSLWRKAVVDTQTLLGAICVYVLLGMFWSFVFTAVGTFGSTPFFVQTTTANTPDYLYFSFVTLTTTGYGDFTAATQLGRSLAVLEALIGQIYLVTVMALLVSNLSSGRRTGIRSEIDDLGGESSQ